MKVLTSTHPRPQDRIPVVQAALKGAEGGAVLADRWKEWVP
jgi:hypothetical protein